MSDALQSKFTIPGVVTLDAGQGGLPRVKIAGAQSDAEIYLNGAHLTQWQPKGQQPVLFTSAKSLFTPGKAIRGGVPIIFPWFGNREGHPESPAHGFARTKPWTVLGAEKRGDGSVWVGLELKSDDSIKALWPHDFRLVFTVLAGETLTMELEVHNPGPEPFSFEEALHTYLAIGDVRQMAITGLSGTTYVDKVDGFKRKPQGAEPIRITGETDRVYLATKAACVVEDGAWDRNVTVAKESSDATVVWNPWVAKARAMSDFGDDEWPGMVCVETCNVAEHAVTLPPRTSHVMKAVVSV